MRNRGPWKSIDDLEIAVAEYIDWFNFRRLHGGIGLIPPSSSKPCTGAPHPLSARRALLHSVHRTRYLMR